MLQMLKLLVLLVVKFEPFASCHWIQEIVQIEVLGELSDRQITKDIGRYNPAYTRNIMSVSTHVIGKFDMMDCYHWALFSRGGG